MNSTKRKTPEDLSEESDRDSPERLPGESAKAFLAFSYYRDLGPSRSEDKAWHRFCEVYGKKQTLRHPSHWGVWSQANNWVERAQAYDDLINEEKRNAETEIRQRLYEDRFRFAQEQQSESQKIVRTLNGNIYEAAAAPRVKITKIFKEAPGKVITTTNLPLNLVGLAHTTRVRNESLKIATHDFLPSELKHEVRPVEVDRVVWIKAPKIKEKVTPIALIKPDPPEEEPESELEPDKAA